MIAKILLGTFACTLFLASTGCEPSTAPANGQMTTERQKGVNTPADSQSPALPRQTDEGVRAGSVNVNGR
jgi:hypothetical protein